VVHRSRRAVTRTAALFAVWLAACLPAASSVPDRGELDPFEPGVTDDGDDEGEPGAAMVPERTPDDGFIARPDLGEAEPFASCDAFAQDCDAGHKCVPRWNDPEYATQCVPLVADPVAEGEPCMVEGSWDSGLDDCGPGLFCWNVDEHNVGVCDDLCGGTIGHPTCDEPLEVCQIFGDAGSCEKSCDPLAQDCPSEDFVCYPLSTIWFCIPDASGADGGFGDRCDFINECDAGHACLWWDAFTKCEGVMCCASLCDTSDPNADSDCAAMDHNQRCEPWYEPGTEPPISAQ